MKTIRRWAEKFGRDYARRLRLRAPDRSDKWHLDEIGVKHWLWRAVDSNGFVLDVLVQNTAIAWLHAVSCASY